ncbi:hypothetical protein [Flagellimonas allohymeniacidonis]|uniref:Uncharacterized protein n=1 Tax=Flagellimonas allohymeniacidonis TaxID=2517819 RepID=A0A4Q8QGU1_9FLAO|nr:hypothetical protein [Allomuricauda hymeniacidonis]TAI48458.1 hypothetical protein EW142_01245 [Allomuricauda hymeniacidonis]
MIWHLPFLLFFIGLIIYSIYRQFKSKTPEKGFEIPETLVWVDDNTSIKPQQIFDFQRELLLQIFSSEDVIRRLDKDHEARKLWFLCQKIIEQNYLWKFPGDAIYMKDYCLASLTFSALILSSGGNYLDFKLGDFTSSGDMSLEKRLRAISRDKDNYYALLAELYFLGWNISKGYKITAFEKEGYPDFKIVNDSYKYPFVVECKCILENTLMVKRIPKIIAKANKQIKAVNEKCYGLCIIDVSTKVEIFMNKSDPTIPEEIIEIERMVKKSLKNKNTSVSAVMLCWKKIYQIGKFTEGDLSNWIRLSSHIIEHPNAKLSFPKNSNLREYGLTHLSHIRIS